MSVIFDKLIALTKQLYPSGRAFKMPFGGAFEKLHNGLAKSEERAWLDAVSIKDSILPDNNNFLADDATAWEVRLGLIVSPTVSLADRKLAIIRKMNHPGTIKARQNFRFLERELRLAGFDVYVYENRFPDGMGGYVTENPLVVTYGAGGTEAQHGQFQHGQRQHSGGYLNKIANNIYQELDAAFAPGSNLRFTFFVGGSPIGSFANVPADRKLEFRQLILKVKPVHTVGFLFVNYV